MFILHLLQGADNVGLNQFMMVTDLKTGPALSPVFIN